MTKDEALLLAIANARGLSTLTDAEAAAVDAALATSADEVRHRLAAAKVAAAQQMIASYDPRSPCGLAGEADALKRALDHQGEVVERTELDRGMPARARARGFPSGKTNPIIAAFFAAGTTDAS